MEDPTKWIEEADGWDIDKHYEERQRNGFSTADWINFDSYIAWVIANAVQKMKDDGNTAFYYPDVPSEQWEALTDAEYDVMIKGFGDYAHCEGSGEKMREIESNLDLALDVFKKRFKSLWD